MRPDYIDAHKFSINHKIQIKIDLICGCSNCLEVFSPLEIRDWIPDKDGTAVCPNCGIDSVIGNSSGYPITVEFLEKMNRYWFN